jgi:hypothetical protein
MNTTRFFTQLLVSGALMCSTVACKLQADASMLEGVLAAGKEVINSIQISGEVTQPLFSNFFLPRGSALIQSSTPTSTRATREMPTVRAPVTLTPSPTVTPTPTATPIPTLLPQLARVMLIGGETKQLSAPLEVTGTLEGMPPCPDLKLQDLKLANLQQIRRAAGGGIEIRAGDDTLIMLPGDATLMGENDAVPLSGIEEVVFQGGRPEERLASQRIWEVFLACGQTILLGDLRAGLVSSSPLEALWGSFQLTLSLEALSTVVRPAEEPDTHELTTTTGITLARLIIAPKKWVEGNSIFGAFRVPWSDVYFAQLVQSPPALPKPETSTFQRIWHIRAEDGNQLDGVELYLKNGEIPPIEVIEVDFNGISTVQINEKGELTLKLTSSPAEFEVEDGSVSGITADGAISFVIPSEHIVELSSTGTPPTPVTDPIEGSLKLFSDDTWDVNELNFSGGQPKHGDHSADPDEIEESLQLNTALMQYWVEWERLRSHGFSQKQAGQVMVSCSGGDLCPVGTVGEEITLSFRHAPFVLQVPLRHVRSYAPMTTPPSQLITPTWEIQVTNREEVTQTVSLSELSFARFPATAWTGRYSVWPFHWYKEKVLMARKADGSQLDVPFDDLTRIDFPNTCQEPTCTAKLSYVDGTTLTISIDPGPTNEDTKKGPASWDAAMEGLLGRVRTGVQVFIPFMNLKSIELKALQPSIDRP